MIWCALASFEDSGYVCLYVNTRPLNRKVFNKSAVASWQVMGPDVPAVFIETAVTSRVRNQKVFNRLATVSQQVMGPDSIAAGYGPRYAWPV